jgi:hypothetical protein
MYLHTIEPRTAQSIFARLLPREKIELRMATPAGIEHMAATMYASDLPGLSHQDATACLTQVRQLCMAEFSEISIGPWWN